MPTPLRRIGIDVGGTNTDAVLLEDGEVAHAVKTPTTEDVTTGILTALASSRPVRASRAGGDRRRGDRHHAFHQRRGAAPASGAGSRRCGSALPAAASLPPFCDWPQDLAELVRGEVFMLEGGHDYDGRPIMPFDEDGMRRGARQIRDSGINARSRSPRSSRRSTRPTRSGRPKSCAEECPDAAITLSRDLGRIGLFERENAALLNAALVDLARETIAGFRDGDRGERHRRAALHHPERRHGDGEAGRRRRCRS